MQCSPTDSFLDVQISFAARCKPNQIPTGKAKGGTSQGTDTGLAYTKAVDITLVGSR